MSRYHCEHCGYEGPAYGTPTSEGVSAPWCPTCGINNQLTPLHVWREKKNATDRRRRGLQLFVVSVITATLLLTLLYLAISVWVIEEAKGDEPTPAPRTQLPSECAHLYNKGKHKEWAACMGVGYE